MATPEKTERARRAFNPDAPIRTPAQARAAANHHAASGHEQGGKRAAQLRKWATAMSQGRRREEAGMHDDAGDSFARAESHRQYLADLGVTVPTRDELNAPAGPAQSPGKPAGALSASRRPSGRGSRSRGAARSPGSLIKGASKGSGVTGLASSGMGIATSVFVGSVALILLMRLIDTKRGGPQVVQFAASGVSRLVDLVIDPVDPFASSASTAPPTAISHSAGAAPAMATPSAPITSTAPASRSATPTH